MPWKEIIQAQNMNHLLCADKTTGNWKWNSWNLKWKLILKISENEYSHQWCQFQFSISTKIEWPQYTLTVNKCITRIQIHNIHLALLCTVTGIMWGIICSFCLVTYLGFLLWAHYAHGSPPTLCVYLVNYEELELTKCTHFDLIKCNNVDLKVSTIYQLFPPSEVSILQMNPPWGHTGSVNIVAN